VPYGVPTTEADLAALADAQSVCFNAPLPDVRGRWWGISGLDKLRVLRRDGAVVGGLLDIPMGTFIGGRSVPTHGVAGVAIAPQARGHGAATELMQRYLAELRARGVALSSLYASTAALYRGVGYGSAGTHFRHALPHAALQGSRDLPVRRLGADDHAELRALYHDIARTRPGWLDRGPYIWQRIFSDYRGRTLAYGVDVDGHLDAYVVYRQTENPGGRYDLELSDLQARSAPAARRLLGLLASHGTMIQQLRWQGAVLDPVLDLLPERRWSTRLYEAWMLRIVDLPAAIAARGWSPVVTATIDLDVYDAALPDNGGRWRLEVEGGQAALHRGGSGRVQVDAAILAGIYTGFVNPWTAAHQGRLRGEAAAIEVLAGIFAGPAPELIDSF